MSEWTAGGDAVTFEEVGDGAGGTITFLDIVDGTDFNGKPERKKVLDIHGKDGEDRRIYIKKGQMESELAKVLKGHGLEAPRVGDDIAVVLVGFKPSKTRGFNPAKVYEVVYKPASAAPAASAGVLQGVSSASDLI